MPWTLFRALTVAGVAAATVGGVPSVAARAPLVVAETAPASIDAGRPATSRWTHRRILDALRAVETNGGLDARDGDRGRAVGPYQIWESYWRDAVDADPSLAWIGDGASRRAARHADCRDAAYAECVVRAYMQRHAPAAWAACDAETIARVHNGGPRGARRATSASYWSRVETALR